MARRIAFIFILILWLSAVTAGIWFMWSYSHTPGAAAAAPARWPNESRLQPPSSGYTLVMAAHPKCPCTRATVEELSKLMAHSDGRLRAYVLFVKPAGAPADWNRTDLWNSVALIPGVELLIDEDGVEADRFGAATSGQVFLYDGTGSLQFRGGITQARGHAGDNAGRTAIESLINNGNADRDRTVVFGCPLVDPDSECRKPNHAKPNN